VQNIILHGYLYGLQEMTYAAIYERSSNLMVKGLLIAPLGPGSILLRRTSVASYFLVKALIFIIIWWYWSCELHKKHHWSIFRTVVWVLVLTWINFWSNCVKFCGCMHPAAHMYICMHPLSRACLFTPMDYIIWIIFGGLYNLDYIIWVVMFVYPDYLSC
jgi:hypothetical protein